MNIKAMVAGALGVFALALTGCSGQEADAAEEPPATLLDPPVASGAPLNGTFLHLSDIHFNPFADGMLQRIVDLPPDQWQAQFDAHASKTPSSGRWSDSNYALMMSALDAAAAAGTYDFILFSGDYLSHNFRENAGGMGVPDPDEFAARTVEFVNSMIEQKFPGKVIVGALGNNDAGCGDYNLRPKGAFLTDLGPDMPGLDPATQKQFAQHGYYAIPHPTVKGTDFITLATYWASKYPEESHGCGQVEGDPGQDQSNWMQQQLQVGASPATNHRKAILLMHIPPGRDGYSGSKQWHDRFETAFEGALPFSARTIVGAFAGHSHMDEFRVLSSKSVPYLAVRVAPSVTTFNGNYPAFTIADYDTGSGAMTDYRVVSLRGGSWQPEYRFTTAYKVDGYTPANLAKISASLQDKDDPLAVQDVYRRYYSSKDAISARCNWQDAVCATSKLDRTAFRACVAQLPARPGDC